VNERTQTLLAIAGIIVAVLAWLFPHPTIGTLTVTIPWWVALLLGLGAAIALVVVALAWLKHPSLNKPHASSSPAPVTVFNEALSVESGGHSEVHARLTEGTVIDVYAQEHWDQDFNFYVMDQANYSTFRNEHQSNDLYGEEDRNSYRFRRTIPKTATWYFVADTYMKKNDRLVDLEVRATDSGKP
jgi:hypothetical protein